MARLSGHATSEGTRARAEESAMGEPFYREAGNLHLSSLGIGTYLGDTDQEAREAYRASIRRALEQGINVVDTASNYRNQASERDIGNVLQDEQARDGVFLVTKGGFLHGDADSSRSVRQVVRDVYVDEGLLEVDDVAGGSHAMTPRFLAHELEASLENLGVDTVDLYLVHNPETQLSTGLHREQVNSRILDAFTFLEERRAEGDIQGYGVATWDGLRVDPENPSHLSLETLLDLAERAHKEAGSPQREHGFRGIQLPFNLAMPEALSRPTQAWRGDREPVLEIAQQEGLIVLGSASLLQGRLLGNVPADVKERLGAQTDLEAALAFARSAPGITTSLVGMGTPEHVDENLDAVNGRSLNSEAVVDVLESSQGEPIEHDLQ